MNSITTEPIEKLYICATCNKSFKTSNALNQHYKSTGHNIHRCTECKKVFTSEISLNQHKKSAHQKKLVCNTCKKKFETQKSLAQHQKDAHKTKYSCPKCKNGFKTEKELSDHIKKEGLFSCSNCDKRFASENGLKQHKKAATCTKKSITCPHCKKGFKNENAMNQHVKSSVCQKKKFVCSHCGKILDSLNSLNQHINSSHLSKKIKCDLCNRKFKTLPALEQHKRTKHTTSISQLIKDITSEEVSILQPKSVVINKLELYERFNLREKISKSIRKIFLGKKIIVMDECLHNNKSVINTLNDRYEVIPLPSGLKTHSDGNLRLALIEKRYGLATRDQEMALIARKMKIKPVYLYIDRKGHKALIRVGKNIEL